MRRAQRKTQEYLLKTNEVIEEFYKMCKLVGYSHKNLTILQILDLEAEELLMDVSLKKGDYQDDYLLAGRIQTKMHELRQAINVMSKDIQNSDHD